MSQTGDWWLGKLIRDINGGTTARGIEGWIPSTFMDVFQGQLSYEEEIFLKLGDKLNSEYITIYYYSNNNILFVLIEGESSKFATLPTRLRESSPSNTQLAINYYP